jgi:hypothetical protein
MTGYGISSQDVDGAIADLDPTMTSVNAGVAACAALTQADAAAWTAAYQRWQQVKSDWAFDKQGSIAPGPVYGTGIMVRIQASGNDADTFDAKLKVACPALAPPPPNPLPGGGGANPSPPSSGGNALDVGGGLLGAIPTWIVLAGAVAGGVYLGRKYKWFGGKK